MYKSRTLGIPRGIVISRLTAAPNTPDNPIEREGEKTKSDADQTHVRPRPRRPSPHKQPTPSRLNLLPLTRSLAHTLAINVVPFVLLVLPQVILPVLVLARATRVRASEDLSYSRVLRPFMLRHASLEPLRVAFGPVAALVAAGIRLGLLPWGSWLGIIGPALWRRRVAFWSIAVRGRLVRECTSFEGSV